MSDQSEVNHEDKDIGTSSQYEERQQELRLGRRRMDSNDSNGGRSDDDTEEDDDDDLRQAEALLHPSTTTAESSALNDASSSERLSFTSSADATASLPIRQTNLPQVCCALLASMTTGGTTYAFGLYGNDLKQRLHLTQGQLDTISTANFCAGLLSWIPGMVVDRFGTKVGIVSGGILGAAALMSFWLVAAKGILSPSADLTSTDFGENSKLDVDDPLSSEKQMLTSTNNDFNMTEEDVDNNASLVVAVLSFLAFLTFLSCALITGSVFKIISCCCSPKSKGSAVGVAKGYVGLGAGVYSSIFESLRQATAPHGWITSNLDFVPMAAFFFIVIATIPSWCFLPSHKMSDSSSSTLQRQLPDVMTPLHFRILYTSLLILAFVIIISSLRELHDDEEQKQLQLEHSLNGGVSDIHNSEYDDEFESDIFSLPSTSSKSTSSPVSNYITAFLLLATWIGPIVAQLFLPQQRQDRQQPSQVLQQQQNQEGTHHLIASDDIDDNEENNDNDENDETQALYQQKDKQKKNQTMSIRTSSTGSIDTSTRDSSSITTDLEGNDGDEDEPNAITTSSDDDDNGDHDHDTFIVQEKNLFQMLSTPSAWLMLWTATILVGGGTVETNNLGQMVESLQFSPVVTSVSLALFSVAQCAGRVLTGTISESAMQWQIPVWLRYIYCCCFCPSLCGMTPPRTTNNVNDTEQREHGTVHGLPRPFFFVISSLLGVIAHGILSISTDETSFLFGIIIAGLAFGSVWPLLVLIVGEIFGTKHVAANYMFYDGITSAGGTLLLSKIIAQKVYENNIIEENDDGGNIIGSDDGTDTNNDDHETNNNGNTQCFGQECFQLTHFIIALLSITCVLTSIVVQYLTRHAYYYYRQQRQIRQQQEEH